VHHRFKSTGLWIACLALFCAGAASATTATPTARLHALFDRAWDQDLRDDPLSATAFGDRRFNDRWPDLGRANLERIHASDGAVLAELRKIPRASLPPLEQTNYDLFEREYMSRDAAWPFHMEAYAIGR